MNDMHAVMLTSIARHREVELLKCVIKKMHTTEKQICDKTLWILQGKPKMTAGQDPYPL